jgi:hypothetical protein
MDCIGKCTGKSKVEFGQQQVNNNLHLAAETKPESPRFGRLDEAVAPFEQAVDEA